MASAPFAGATQGITGPNTATSSPHFYVPTRSDRDKQIGPGHFNCGVGTTYAIPHSYKTINSFGDKLVDCEMIFQNPQQFIDLCNEFGKEIEVEMPVHPTLGAAHLWAADDTAQRIANGLGYNGEYMTGGVPIIFTPSYKRGASIGRYLKDRVGSDKLTVVVIHDMEKEEYKHVLNLEETALLILPDDVLGIGATRNWILATAMHWGLKRCWMIDDNVDPNNLTKWSGQGPRYGSTYRIYTKHTFQQALCHLESVMLGDDLIGVLGPASPKSVSNLDNNPTLISHRAPTSFVLLNVALLRSKEIQYFNCLTQKEDIMLAYTCVKRGLRIVVDQRITFTKEYDRSTGAMRSGLEVCRNKRMAAIEEGMQNMKIKGTT